MRTAFKYVKYFIVLCCCGMIGAGCNIVNPVEPTPTYVHIDSFQFKANSLVRSYTTSHAINNVWVYYDNNLIGEYDLPVTFPVITDGTDKGKLELFPGITINGLGSSLDEYPFYQPDTSFALKQQPGKTITYNPTTTYYSDAKIVHVSNFDDGTLVGFGLEAGNVALFGVSNPDSLVFEGTGSGMIFLQVPGVDSSVDSSVAVAIPSGGSAYIEFDYKSDLSFYVGLQSNLSATIGSTPYYLAGIYPSTTWQKFYLNITTFIAQYQGTNYNVYIKAALPAGQAPGRLLIDNIQIVTF